MMLNAGQTMGDINMIVSVTDKQFGGGIDYIEILHDDGTMKAFFEGDGSCIRTYLKNNGYKSKQIDEIIIKTKVRL